jgi:hypothetical protein
MLDFGPGPGAAPSPDADEEPDDEPRAPGMEKITPEAAAAREKAHADKTAKDEESDEAKVSDERLRALKEKARAKIEARLVAKRKQRKLLRGGDVPGTRRR